MIKTKKKKVVSEELSAKICDACRKEYDVVRDRPEAQEFVHVTFVGGYSSVFGDGALVTVDLCQHCVKKVLGAYLKIKNE